LPDEYSNNSNFIFLEPSYDNYNKNYSIYVFQYPRTILSYAKGKIESSSGFNYFHNASTNNGSSGAPLINRNMKVIGVHKAGMTSVEINIATNFSIVKDAINILYNKRYINNKKKARESTRELSDDEKIELKKHGLIKTLLSNMFKCPFSSSSLVMLFYRTNHGWYFTVKDKHEIKYNINKIKLYNWVYINPYKKIEDIIKEIYEKPINEFGKKPNNKFDKKLEHRHELIIQWLKISELMYM